MNLVMRALKLTSELKTMDGYDRHIHSEGSREHVLSYSNKGVHCSHPNCVVNREQKSDAREWIFIKEESETSQHMLFKHSLNKRYGLAQQKRGGKLK